MWWDASVPASLRKADADGYQVVIFSNQGGVNLKGDPKMLKPDTKRLGQIKTKVTAMLNNLDINISFYAATEKDEYRKPRPGMWKEALEHFDLDAPEEVDLEASFYVGDAAGRTGDDQKSDVDFASSDRLVASLLAMSRTKTNRVSLG